LERLGNDLGMIVFGSQEMIHQACEELREVYNSEEVSQTYKYYLLHRIIAGLFLSLGILYIVYRGLSFFVPSVSNDLGAKLLVLSLTVLIYWGVGMLYSKLVFGDFVPPFHGFISLINNADVIRDMLTSSYNQTLVNYVGGAKG